MKLVTYNIQYGLGVDNRYDLDRITSEIQGADIIALQEVDRFWKRSGMVDSPQKIAEAFPRHHWVYGPNLDMDASFEKEGRIISRRKQFGTMILSAWPIISSRNHLLPKWGTRHLHSIQQGMLEAVIKTPLGPIRFYSVHLSHLCPETRQPQIEAMLRILSTAPDEGGAWCGGHPDPQSGWLEEDEPPMPRSAIIMGDMNMGPESENYSQILGPYSQRYGRLSHRNGLVDAWVAAGHKEQSGHTAYNVSNRIDHCFVTADLADHVSEMHIDSDAKGSDHFPVWITLKNPH